MDILETLKNAEMKTFTSKSIRGGWQSETSIKFGKNRVLDITTRKRYNGMLTTVASVATIEGAFKTHAMYQDLNINLMNHTHVKRVTSNSCEKAHLHVIEDKALMGLLFDKVIEGEGANNV